MHGHGPQETPRKTTQCRKRVGFFTLSNLAALCEKYRSRTLPASSLYESQSQARIAASIEQSTDSSVTFSPSVAPRTMSRLRLCTLNFDAELHYGIFKVTMNLSSARALHPTPPACAVRPRARPPDHCLWWRKAAHPLQSHQWLHRCRTPTSDPPCAL